MQNFLFLKTLRATRYLFALLAQYTFLFLYALPVLRLKSELASGFLISRGFESFFLKSNSKFIKLAASARATVDTEYENYVRLLNDRPDLADIVSNFRLIKTMGLKMLSSENMSSIPAKDALDPAVRIYHRFTDENFVSRECLELEECQQIGEGLRLISANFNLETANLLRASVERFLTLGDYTVGVAHGDFHSRNLMFDASGACRLIDLDCVRLQGIIEFDALYFSLEQQWSISGQLWTKTLAECFRSKSRNIASSMKAFSVKWTNELGIAFFLDRIGQEYINYGIRYSYRDLDAVIEAALILNSETK